jgi:hypothetical protein
LADENQRALLAGPPAEVSGVLPFYNATDEEVTIDEVVVCNLDKGEKGDKEDLPRPVEAVTVAPGCTARIAVRLALRPQTAAGPYFLTVTIGGVETEVTAYVAENRELALSPDALVIDNVPAAKVVKQVVIENQGNVPVFVADFGEVSLYREDTALGTLLAIARPSPTKAAATIEPLPEPAATMMVTTGGGRVEIPPGQGRAVDLTVTIPSDLSQSTRYLTGLPIAGRMLLVVLVPAGPKPQDPS